jgi:tetratricopeptide (TPR) repeat protein
VLADAERSEDALAAALEDACRARLLSEGQDDTYAFAHDLVREVIVAEMPAARRIILHRRIAQVLEALPDPMRERRYAALAYHFLEARERASALRYATLAGDQAEAIHAHAEAERHYLVATDLARELGDRAGEAQMLEKLGDLLELTSQHDDARAVHERVVALDQAGSCDLRRTADLHCKIAQTYSSQRRLAEAMEACERGIAALGDAPGEPTPQWWHSWLDLHLLLMLLHYFPAHVPEMAALAERIRPAVERYGTPQQRSGFFMNLFSLHHKRDGSGAVSDEALAYAQAARLAAEESGSLRTIAGAENLLAFAHLWHGDLDDAERHYHATLSLAERIPSGREGDLAVLGHTHLAIIHRLRGQVDETERSAELALSAATAQQMPLHIAVARANLAWVAWRRGNHGEVERQALAALELWRHPVQHLPLQWGARWPLIAAACARDRLSQAIAYARVDPSPMEIPLPAAQATLVEEALRAWDSRQPEVARARLTAAMARAQATGYL